MDPLSAYDFAVIVTVFLISASIGMYFRLSGGRQQTTDEFLQAERSMGILPVSLSVMATYISTVTLMGMPAEIYMFGTHMAFFVVGIVLGMLAAAFVFMPVYFNAQVSTSYEYLEKRYGSTARTACSLMYAIQAIFFMSVVLYTPALALSAVANLSPFWSVLTIGAVCTFYCTLGGMKAVLWTDVFQSLLMYICLFSIITKGIMDFGFFEIFQISKDGGRLIIPSFSPSISLKYTGWNIILMGFTMSTFTYGTSQLQVQRLLVVKNSRKSQLSMLTSIPFTAAFYFLCCFCGLIFYATFRNCDPLHDPRRKISSADQLMPYYIMKEFGKYPGLPGLSICGIFAASLSTVSSSIQTLTVVTMKDFLGPFCKNCGFSQENQTLCAKALTIFFGLLGVFLSFVVATWGNIFEATIVLFNLSGGPILGLFLLAVLTTRANEKGVVIGIVSSFFLAVWLSFGPFTSIHEQLSYSTAGCSLVDVRNYTFIKDYNSTFEELLTDSTTGLDETNKLLLSHLWVTPIALISCVVIGYACSVLIENYTGEKKHIPSEFSSPIFLWFQKIMFNGVDSSEKEIINEKLNETKL